MNNLLQYFPNLRQISEKSTEHEGPCPLCKGGEDRFCLWTDGGIENTGRFFCRQCERSGNAVTLLQEALGMSEAAARVAAGLDRPEDWKRRPWKLGTVAGEWRYTDEHSTDLYRSVRYEPPSDHPLYGTDKTFLPYVAGAHKAGLPKAVRRVPYRLPELLEGIERSDTVILVEGEKHADALIKLGFTATTTVSGAGSWLDTYADFMDGAPLVAILPDNDKAGRKYAALAAASMDKRDIACKIVELPVEREKDDVIDWLAAGGTANALRQLIEAAPEAEPPDEYMAADLEAGHTAPRADENEKEEHKTTAQILLEMASDWKLFHAPDGTEYAVIPAGSHREVQKIRTKGARAQLRRKYFAATRKAPNAQAMQDAVEVLCARALFEGEAEEVHIRVAEHEGRIYVDLANERWQCVEIDAEGWRVIDNPPVRFTRPASMLPLPMPAARGDLEALRRHVALEDEPFALLLAFLLSCLWPRGSYPVLALKGEHGSGKSTICRQIRQLVDPATTLLRSPPKTDHDLIIAAKNARLVAFDNLSTVPDTLSDGLCRLATGSGFGARQLYTDGEEVLFAARRPVLVNGISDLLHRPDLADRAVELLLPTIEPERRKTDEQVKADFERDRPVILAGIFDALSVAVSRAHSLSLATLPRMADFALMAVAAEPAFPVPEGTFMAAYESNRAASVEQAAENDDVVAAIRAMLDDEGPFEGTTSELREALTKYLPKPDKPPKSFPSSVQAMTAHLRRVAPVLRGIGIERTDLPREGKTRRRLLQIDYRGKSTAATVTTAAPAKLGQKQRFLADEVADEVEGGTVTTAAPRPPENGLNGTKNAEADEADEADEVSATKSIEGGTLIIPLDDEDESPPF